MGPCGSTQGCDVLASQGRYAEAEVHMQAARFGFEALLERHFLAFADHGAEFYAGSGNNSRRAVDHTYD